ncbi:MAG: ABC transporter ATP-binding protein [Peptococcaceae bacterium]|nr:ABC transporter ATP-binding protein [Peptococcaceae bacterium]
MIRTKCISKIYGESNESMMYALKDVSITIEDGEVAVILGHSGAGKTTLINVLSALDMPTIGQIIYDDLNITNLKGPQLTKFRRESIGFVFQQFHLVPMLTAYENIEVAANLVKAKRHHIYELIERVNLVGKEGKYPFQLSGGEQQRVAIARALAKKPKVLFCDEPTGALDEENGNKVLTLIGELNAAYKLTIVMVTHNPIIGKMADRMITMKNGMVVTNSKRKATIPLV